MNGLTVGLTGLLAFAALLAFASSAPADALLAERSVAEWISARQALEAKDSWLLTPCLPALAIRILDLVAMPLHVPAPLLAGAGAMAAVAMVWSAAFGAAGYRALATLLLAGIVCLNPIALYAASGDVTLAFVILGASIAGLGVFRLHQGEAMPGTLLASGGMLGLSLSGALGMTGFAAMLVPLGVAVSAQARPLTALAVVLFPSAATALAFGFLYWAYGPSLAFGMRALYGVPADTLATPWAAMFSTTPVLAFGVALIGSAVVAPGAFLIASVRRLCAGSAMLAGAFLVAGVAAALASTLLGVAGNGAATFAVGVGLSGGAVLLLGPPRPGAAVVLLGLGAMGGLLTVNVVPDASLKRWMQALDVPLLEVSATASSEAEHPQLPGDPRVAVLLSGAPLPEEWPRQAAPRGWGGRADYLRAQGITP